MTCKQICAELTDISYHDTRFDIQVYNLFRNTTRTAQDFGFLAYVPIVQVRVEIVVEYPFEIEVQMLAGVLDFLHKSERLKRFAFHLGVRSVACALPHPLAAGFKLGADNLRKVTTRQGVRARRNAKEREMDYALGVLQMLRVHGCERKRLLSQIERAGLDREGSIGRSGSVDRYEDVDEAGLR